MSKICNRLIYAAGVILTLFVSSQASAACLNSRINLKTDHTFINMGAKKSSKDTDTVSFNEICFEGNSIHSKDFQANAVSSNGGRASWVYDNGKGYPANMDLRVTRYGNNFTYNMKWCIVSGAINAQCRVFDEKIVVFSYNGSSCSIKSFTIKNTTIIGNIMNGLNGRSYGTSSCSVI